MTDFDRFDPFERRITDAIEEIAAIRTPDYLDDIFRQTVRTSQRPRWTFLERWLPMDTILSRPAPIRRVPIRSLLVTALLIGLLAAALAFYAGTQRRLPPPFGLADNGSIAYTSGGDLYVRDALTGTGRLLVGAGGDQFAPVYSPDGTRLSFFTHDAQGDHLTIANADGTGAREIALIPSTGRAQAVWSPSSAQVALIYEVDGGVLARIWLGVRSRAGGARRAPLPESLLPDSRIYET